MKHIFALWYSHGSLGPRSGMWWFEQKCPLSVPPKLEEMFWGDGELCGGSMNWEWGFERFTAGYHIEFTLCFMLLLEGDIFCLLAFAIMPASCHHASPLWQILIYPKLWAATNSFLHKPGIARVREPSPHINRITHIILYLKYGILYCISG